MTVATIDIPLDKALPQHPEAERSVLGAILLDNTCFDKVISIIQPEDFYREAHRIIFFAIVELRDRNIPVDLLTLKEGLAKRESLEKAGGAAYIYALADNVPDLGNVERYADIIREKSMLRSMILAGNRLINSASDPASDASEVLGRAEESIYRIAERSVRTGFIDIQAITRDNISTLQNIDRSRGMLTGVSTGFDELNRMTSGFQKQDLIILAARPSMGKTSLMLNMAEAVAIPDVAGMVSQEELQSVGIFSLEMSREQIGLRILSSESGVTMGQMRSGLLNDIQWGSLAQASARIARGKIYVDDTAGIEVMEMRAKARRLQMEFGLDMIMVDYLQLCHARGRQESRNQEVSQISRSLKAIAKELNVPLVSLSQLSRRPEQRAGDHRPQLSDLRESGSIEQDADLVAFIYRDEVYNKDSADKGLAEIIVAKQRNGPIGDFKLHFRNEITKFFNLEPG